MAIGNLPARPKWPNEDGAPDLWVSERARKEYTALIRVFRGALSEQRNKIASLADLGIPPRFPPAENLHMRLQQYANDAQIRVDKISEYLERFEKAVDEAFKRMQAADQA